jgi:hypothetical protein
VDDLLQLISRWEDGGVGAGRVSGRGGWKRKSGDGNAAGVGPRIVKLPAVGDRVGVNEGSPEGARALPEPLKGLNGLSEPLTSSHSSSGLHSIFSPAVRGRWARNHRLDVGQEGKESGRTP